MSVECTTCRRDFDSKASLASHKGAGHNKPWMQEERVRTEYVEKERTATSLADEWGCDSATVLNWLDKFGIETRSAGYYSRKERVRFNTQPTGYEVWKLSCGSDRGKTIYVHRLMAVAEHGLEAVKDKHVHHKNRIPWVNTPENIEIMDPKEHNTHHYENGDYKIGPRRSKEEKSEMRNSL